MKVKRRKFLQYAGLSSVGLMFASRERAIASALGVVAGSQDPKLETFSFSAPTLDHKGRINYRQMYTAKFFPEPLTTREGRGAEKLEMVSIVSGRFQMGASKTEASQKSLISNETKLFTQGFTDR